MEMVSEASHHVVNSLPKLMANFCVGYWSSGTRLADSARVAGEGIEEGNLPEYLVSYDVLSPELGDQRQRRRGVG